MEQQDGYYEWDYVRWKERCRWWTDMNDAEINAKYDELRELNRKAEWFAEKAFACESTAKLEIAASYKVQANTLASRLTAIANCNHVMESVRQFIGRPGVLTELPIVINPSMLCRKCGYER